jgi:hypothetical protein
LILPRPARACRTARVRRCGGRTAAARASAVSRLPRAAVVVRAASRSGSAAAAKRSVRTLFPFTHSSPQTSLLPSQSTSRDLISSSCILRALPRPLITRVLLRAGGFGIPPYLSSCACDKGRWCCERRGDHSRRPWVQHISRHLPHAR